MFQDRIDAGHQLAKALEKFRDREGAVVMALPRGGVVPGYVVAKQLHLPLEVVMVKKLAHPSNDEYAIGAVSLKSRIINGHVGVSQDYLDEATKNIRKLLSKRYDMYHENKPPVDLKNKLVIVVDDGVATGKTMIASLQLIREEQPKKIIVAVPVGPTDSIEQLKPYADEVICLETYDDFYAISLYYGDFSQITDEQVKSLLSKSGHLTKNHSDEKAAN